jgi:hypothetical protein
MATAIIADKPSFRLRRAEGSWPHRTGQSHFKLRDDFVLKGHGFSRAEERS